MSPAVRERNKHILEPEVKPKATGKRSTEEADLQNEIVAQLQNLGYLVAHFRPAKVIRHGVEKYDTPVFGNATGFPDVIAVHPHTGAFLVLELKSEEGRVKDDQLEWLRAYLGVQVPTEMIVRPSKWKDVRRLLWPSNSFLNSLHLYSSGALFGTSFGRWSL